MFGKNQQLGPSVSSDGSLLVREVFLTIQGEGPHVGTPAVFVRLGGCNLACHFCDTEFDVKKSKMMTPYQLMQEVLGCSRGTDCWFIVLTGGEPFRQNIVPFIVEATSKSPWRVQIETDGVMYQPGLETLTGRRVSIVCSPKTPKIHPAMRPIIHYWKYIVRAGELAADGLPGYSTQRKGEMQRLYRPWEDDAYDDDVNFRGNGPEMRVWLQPCEEYTNQPKGTFGDRFRDHEATQRNTDAAVQSCLEHGYKLSLQTHKILGLR